MNPIVYLTDQNEISTEINNGAKQLDKSVFFFAELIRKKKRHISHSLCSIDMLAYMEADNRGLSVKKPVIIISNPSNIDYELNVNSKYIRHCNYNTYRPRVQVLSRSVENLQFSGLETSML